VHLEAYSAGGLCTNWLRIWSGQRPARPECRRLCPPAGEGVDRAQQCLTCPVFATYNVELLIGSVVVIKNANFVMLKSAV
jgi:hypothetical protein